MSCEIGQVLRRVHQVRTAGDVALPRARRERSRQQEAWSRMPTEAPSLVEDLRVVQVRESVDGFRVGHLDTLRAQAFDLVVERVDGDGCRQSALPLGVGDDLEEDAGT